MDFKRRPLGKSLAAMSANVRLLPRVDALVLLQLLLSREALRAQGASMRLVPGVDPAVELQLLLAGESLAADVAQDRHINPVLVVLAELVPLQSGGGGVVLVANCAVVLDERHARHYLPVLRASVRRQEPREHKMLAANLALKRLFPGMKVLVFQRMRADRKRLVAYFALVLSRPFVRANVHLKVIPRRALIVAHVARIFITIVVFNRVQAEKDTICESLIAGVAMDSFVFVLIVVDRFRKLCAFPSLLLLERNGILDGRD